MKVLVTGSHGFIGSYLVRHLRNLGHEAICVDLKIGKDVWEIKKRDLLEVGFVVHLAAFADVRRSLEEPDLYFHNNIRMTKDLQEKCHDTKTPMLYASSSCVHKWFLSPYGTSKMVNEQTAFENQIGLRFTTVYGDGCREGMLFDRIKNRTLTSITNHIRDFIHVEDVVDAIMVFIEQGLDGKRPVYDIGTGISIKVDEMVNNYLGMNVPVVNGLPCEAQDNTCDPRNMQELGWLATKNFIDYVRE